MIERFPKGAKRWLLDGTSMFTTGVMFLAPMEIWKSGALHASETRGWMGAIGFAGVARLYGWWREGWSRAFDLTPTMHGFRKYLNDFAANVVFFNSFYVPVLYSNGLTPETVTRQTLYANAIAFVGGRGYGLVRDAIFDTADEPATLSGSGEGRNSRAAHVLNLPVLDACRTLFTEQTIDDAYARLGEDYRGSLSRILSKELFPRKNLESAIAQA